MFDIGTKVVVIGSTTKKNKTGPKKGSIGFILRSTLAHNLFYKEPYKLLQVYKVMVLFIRYGFEKKPRFEVKNITTVLALGKHNMNEKEFIKTMSIDMDKKDYNDSFIDVVRIDKPPVCTLVPADTCSNILRYDQANLLGWISAIMRYLDIIERVIYNTSRCHKLLDKNILAALLDCQAENVSRTIPKVRNLVESLNRVEIMRLVRSLSIIKGISAKNKEDRLEEDISSDIFRFYDDGMAPSEIMVDLEIYLMRCVYTDSYPKIRAYTKSTLQNITSEFGRSEEMIMYNRLLSLLDNTRETAIDLGCAFSRSFRSADKNEEE